MKKEDLKVGMKIFDKNQNEGRIVLEITENRHYKYVYFYDTNQYIDDVDCLDRFEPVKQKKTVTLYRYTLDNDGEIYQTCWRQSKDHHGNYKVIKTETKEIDID